MPEIFEIEGTDRRNEIIEAVDNETEFIAQKPSGKDVKYFSPSTGFVLLKENTRIRLNSKRTRRVASVAKLSLDARLELREFYYAMRSAEMSGERLSEPFGGISDLYRAVLKSIDYMEILCDVHRSKFTLGKNTNGFIFYGHSYELGNPNAYIGMSEHVAKEGFSRWQVEHSQNIIHLEKGASASRLVEMGFSELTNSIISTTGGYFTRAVYELANRFHNSKDMIFFADGDAFGNDMLRTLEFGSKASRHLTPDQAFPSSVYPNIHIAGLFPSVAERLAIPNDEEQKRPLNNKHVRRRIDFLKKYNLIDDRDVATWERDKTYELEALSIFFKSQVPNIDGEYTPIGLGIYLVEFMRLNNIQCKPQPVDDDMELMNNFEKTARRDLKEQIHDHIRSKAPMESLKEYLEQKFEEIIEKIVTDIYDDHIDKMIDDYVNNLGADDLRDLVQMQYQDEPKRQIYSLREIADDIIDGMNIEVEWNTEELQNKIDKAVAEYMQELPEDLHDIFEAYIEFAMPDPVTNLKDFYDVVLEELGADPDDCKKVREALKWRLDK